MSHDLAVIEETPNHLIALALDKGADPDTLSKLMDLQDRWERGKAQKAFVVAMTAFKQECPAVLKKADVVDFTSSKGRTNYRYANLGSIVQEITAVMGKHELSASWSTEQNGAMVTVTCHITHVGGHRESVTLTGPIDESGNKNAIQAVGSTVTYLQRYTLLAALGLATGEDDDGRGGANHTQETPAKSMDAAVHESSKPFPCPDCQKAGRDGTLKFVKEGQNEKGKWRMWVCTLSKQDKSGVCQYVRWQDPKHQEKPANPQPAADKVSDPEPQATEGLGAIKELAKKLNQDGKALNDMCLKHCGGKGGVPWAEQSETVLSNLLNFLLEMQANDPASGTPFENE